MAWMKREFIRGYTRPTKIREKERSTSSQKAIEHLKSSLIFLGTAIKLEEEKDRYYWLAASLREFIDSVSAIPNMFNEAEVEKYEKEAIPIIKNIVKLLKVTRSIKEKFVNNISNKLIKQSGGEITERETEDSKLSLDDLYKKYPNEVKNDLYYRLLSEFPAKKAKVELIIKIRAMFV